MTIADKDKQTLIAYQIEKAKNTAQDAMFLYY